MASKVLPLLTPRTYTILSVLNDLKDAFQTLLLKPNKHPALLVIYAFIDICASLASGHDKKTSQQVFVSYLDESLTPGTKRVITPKQLWAARSALLHTFSPLGRHTGPDKSPPTFYYAAGEDRDSVRKNLKSRGYSAFTLLSVEEIAGIAIWAFNDMITRMERESAFRLRVIRMPSICC